MDLIEVKNVSKHFKVPERDTGIRGGLKYIFKPKFTDFQAVKDVTFSVRKGDIMGFIGKNGAGKSTTIKMMTGILSPTSGEILIDGMNVEKNRRIISRKFGVVFGQRTQLWWDIPVIDTYNIFKELYKISDEEYKNNLKLFDDILELNTFLKKPARQLSLGQRMRADLAASLLHNPDILFLDEPTIGLDISVKEKVRNFIKTINQDRGVTIILTTHDIDDIERLSKDIIVIDKGNILFRGDIEDLKDNYGKITTIIIHGKIDKVEQLKSVFHGYDIRVSYNEQIIVEFNKSDYSVSEVMNKILSVPDIQEFNIIETSLEDIVRKIYDSDQGVLL
ncbi:MAG: ATP-binding cassette domain-containing protein [Eubacterium sp.]|nr:ATP-binding cassette domain-containing protein [Eubacterium sp.]